MKTDEEVRILRESLKTVNTSIAVLQGKREEKQKRLQEIFKKYGVADINQFRALFLEKQKNFERVVEEAETFINKSKETVARVESVIAGV